MTPQPANIDKLLHTPAFGSFDKVLTTHLTNESTRHRFDMENLGMMDVKTLNSVLSDYNKKACTNAPIFSAIKFQKFLALHRHVKGKFVCGQAVTASSILPFLSKIKQDYIAASVGIGTEDKYTKSAVTPVIFNSPDKVIPLIVY